MAVLLAGVESSHGGSLRNLSTPFAAGSTQFSSDGRTPIWSRDLGTLGGGTHFIELCPDAKDAVWKWTGANPNGDWIPYRRFIPFAIWASLPGC